MKQRYGIRTSRGVVIVIVKQYEGLLDVRINSYGFQWERSYRYKHLDFLASPVTVKKIDVRYTEARKYCNKLYRSPLQASETGIYYNILL